MNVTCKDRDRIFEDGTPAEWVALETHASVCPACGEELRAWKALSVAAQGMREYTESRALWTRIERSLIEEDARRSRFAERLGWFSFLKEVPMGWQTAAAGSLVLLLTISAGWFYLHSTKVQPRADQSFLKSKALSEVESAEAAYVQAIDKLAAEANPQLESPGTPLLANYHEKLLLLDSAIADLRAQAGLNPSNAQLRHQLLAMYQEKQQTLEEVLEVRKQ